MPIYDYGCDECSLSVEKLQEMGGRSPQCPKCGVRMRKQPTYPAMVKVKGSGGYPFRRKQIRNAPLQRPY